MNPFYGRRDLCRAREITELPDIGAKNESGALVGKDGDTGGQVLLRMGNQGVQFEDNFSGKRVDGFALAVEKQPENFVVIFLDAPVLGNGDGGQRLLSFHVRGEFCSATPLGVKQLSPG